MSDIVIIIPFFRTLSLQNKNYRRVRLKRSYKRKKNHEIMNIHFIYGCFLAFIKICTSYPFRRWKKSFLRNRSVKQAQTCDRDIKRFLLSLSQLCFIYIILNLFLLFFCIWKRRNMIATYEYIFDGWQGECCQRVTMNDDSDDWNWIKLN